MSIGQRIKEQRNKKGLTQSELAKEIGITLDMVKSMETNRSNPSIETLSKLCDTFNVSADYLLGRDGQSLEIKKAKLRNIVDISNQFKQHLLEHNDLPPMEIQRNYLMTVREYGFDKNPQPWNFSNDPNDHIKLILKLVEEEFKKISEQEKQSNKDL